MTDAPRLTSLSHGGGCACKISPGDLAQVLGRLPPIADPRVLVGTSTSDDAGVFRFGDGALVATVDVFTPIVDDPYDYGRIAATNALSDVYAMGGKPLFALSFIAFPSRTLPLEIMSRILAGGAEVAKRAGIAIIGGHSIDDAEPKYGLAVIGSVDPERVVRNSTARAGDKLFLTKPIGTGVIAQSIKKGESPPGAAEAAIKSMTTLNDWACLAMVEVGVNAATDVTGFGLLGHLLEMVRGSGVGARIEAGKVPLLPGAYELAAAGLVPGGSKRNYEHVAPHLVVEEGVDPTRRVLLADAQTSGGLLIAVAPEKAGELVDALVDHGCLVAEVGQMEPGDQITVEP
jgi:selenide,water dikinase